MTRASAGSRERMRGMTGFFIDTQGHCFLCSNQISSPESEKITSPHSLQYLSRYLGLNLRKVFSEEVKLPPEVVAKLEKGVLGARLCEGCALWNDKFSKLCSQLERIKMEVEDCLGGIHDKLSQIEEGRQELNGSTGSKHQSPALRIADALRKQAIVKGSLKLRRSQPRIILPKLRMETPDVPISMDTDEDEDMSSIPVIQYSVPMKEEKPAVALHLDSDNEDSGGDFAESLVTPYHTDDAFEQSLDCDLSTHVISTDFDVKQDGIEETMEETETVPLEKLSEPKNVDNPVYIYDTSTKKFQCKSCKKQFNKRANCIRHHQSIHEKLRHRCPICNKEFRDTDSLALHHKSVHLGRRFRCRTCTQVFTTRFEVVVHQRESQGTCRVGSDEVEVIFSKQSKIPNDLIRPFKCQSCPKKFTTLGYRRIHFRNFHLNVRVACSQCEKTYAVKRSLLEHFKKAHQGKDNIITRCYSFNASTRKYECEPCRMQFTSEIHCSIHYKNAHSKLMEKCSLCPLEFRHRSGLLEHHNTVHLKMKFRCRTCNLVSPYRWKILTHQRKSQGACRSGRNEVEAVQTTGNEEGGKLTYQVAPLPTDNVPPSPPVWTHPNLPTVPASRVHSKEWECNECGREFNSEMGLQYHMESVHMGLRYTCEACNKIFKNKDSFRLHQQKTCKYRKNPNQIVSQEQELGMKGN